MNEIDELCSEYKVKHPSDLLKTFIGHSLFGPINPDKSQEMRSILLNELDKFESISARILFLKSFMNELSDHILGFKYLTKPPKEAINDFNNNYPFILQELESLQRQQDNLNPALKPKTQQEKIQRVEEIYRQTKNYPDAIKIFNEEMKPERGYKDYNSFKAARNKSRKKK